MRKTVTKSFEPPREANVLASWIVQYPYFLNPKFQASSNLQWLYSLVCVRPGQKSLCWFSHVAANLMRKTDQIGWCSFPRRKFIWAPAWENQQFGFWPGLTQTRLYSHWRWLEVGNFVFRKKRYCTIQVAKTKALINFVVTPKLICAFVFAYYYAKRWFFHDVALIISQLSMI